MSITKELIEQERQSVQAGLFRDIHLHQEGSFLRAYDWSAWLNCHYLHDFKVKKRVFKGIDEPVAYIGFPETSLNKWISEGAEKRMDSEKHLVLTLPEVMVTDSSKYHQQLSPFHRNTINHRKRTFQILEKCYFYTIINLEKCKKTKIFTLEKCILFAIYACV